LTSKPNLARTSYLSNKIKKRTSKSRETFSLRENNAGGGGGSEGGSVIVPGGGRMSGALLTGNITFIILKGQSHEKVCEIMTKDARIGLN
jgi:hypothetical protein